MSIKYNPPNFKELKDEHIAAELDLFAQRITLIAKTTDSTAVMAPNTGGGYRWTHGRQLITGSQIGMPTGLTKVTNAGGGLDNGVGATNFTISISPSTTLTGGIDIRVWKPTSAGDNTPIVATAPINVTWWAAGQ